MKKKITKIWGVGLVLVLLVSLFGVAVPASAGDLSFGADTSVPSITNNILVSTGLSILDLAVANDGTTIWAATGNTSGQQLFKSTDAGATWTQKTAPSAFTGDLSLVAVAPDNPSIVAIFGNTTGLATNLTGYVSTNGGSTWSTLGTVTDVEGPTSATAIYDIDISPDSSGTHYIAAAGTSGANEPEVYYFNLGAAAPLWKGAAQDFTTDLVVGAIDNFRAVKFSPNFASDQVLTAVSEEIGAAGAGALRMHLASFNLLLWDSVAGFSNYPKTIDSVTSANFTANAVSIALAPTYLGSDDTERIAFVGASITTDAAAETGGLWRLKDTTLKEMLADTGIYSVAYDGTNLVAGPTADNNVRRSADALVTTPTVSSSRSLKRPGGASNINVAWNGADVVAGGAGASSAFAVSKDNGMTFNDISLIDTALTTMLDFWVTPDGARQYLLATDATEVSLWRKDSSWQRVFFIASSLTDWFVRGAPSDNNALYIVDQGGTTMYYTQDGGENKWFTRASRYNVQDLAVENTDTAYVAVSSSSSVSKSTNGGFTWATSVASSLAGGNISTIAVISEGNLIVGGSTGYIAYSTDGNSTWTKNSKQLNGAAVTQVTASGLASGDYIYAATSAAATKVERWLIGTDTTWTDMVGPQTATFGANGIALVSGVLYVVADNSSDSEVWRTLNPTADSVSWSTMVSAGETFDRTPSALRVGAGSVKLWFINSAATPDTLFSYTDTLATAGPTLVAPANGYKNTVNLVTGRSVDIGFSWDKPSKNVTDYEIAVYTDAAATTRIAQHFVSSTAAKPVVVMGPYQSTTQTVEFSPGTTYYWRVRVKSTGPVYSPWSEIRSLTIEPGAAAVPAILSPVNGASDRSQTPSFSWAPVAGATDYQFVLANNAGLVAPIVSVTIKNSTAYSLITPLNYGVTYFWRVKPLAPVEGDWSAVSNFTVMAEPTAPAPPIVVQQVPAPVINIPAPPPAQNIVIPPAPPAPAPIAPAYIWAIIVIGAVLVIAVIVLIVRTRRAV